MVSAFDAIREGLAAGSGLDQLNLILGVTGVALMIRRSLWAFPVGMAAVTVQGVLFCLGYGWWNWLIGRGERTELPVTLLSWRERMGWIAGASLLMLIWGTWQANHTDATVPYRDTFIASFSMASQVLQARKKLENWVGWVVVNSVAIVTYWSIGEIYWVFLYLVFWGMGISGWVAWYRAMKLQEAPGR